MADTVDVKVLFSSGRRHIVRLLGQSDGTGEDAVVKIDKSALQLFNGLEPGKLAVDEIEWNVQGMDGVLLAFDHTTDDEIAVLTGNGYKDYRCAGGFSDPQSAGGTGDIVLTTLNANAGAVYDILIDVRLKA